MLRRQPRFTLTDKLFPHTSLFRYPVEGRFDVAPPAVVVEPPGPLPTDLAGRLARWDADATKAQQDFAAERNLTAPLVSAATGSAMSSERRSEAHTSELQSLMRLSYDVVCLKIKRYDLTNAHI